ncbi:MAG: hypothetical protein ABR605_04160, partial [Desulfurivibrionaceae bacterium]
MQDDARPRGKELIQFKKRATEMTEKEAYQKKRSAQLREWQAKIEGLKAKADKAAAEQQIKFYKEIESLRKKQ